MIFIWPAWIFTFLKEWDWYLFCHRTPFWNIVFSLQSGCCGRIFPPFFFLFSCLCHSRTRWCHMIVMETLMAVCQPGGLHWALPHFQTSFSNDLYQWGRLCDRRGEVPDFCRCNILVLHAQWLFVICIPPPPAHYPVCSLPLLLHRRIVCVASQLNLILKGFAPLLWSHSASTVTQWAEGFEVRKSQVWHDHSERVKDTGSWRLSESFGLVCCPCPITSAFFLLSVFWLAVFLPAVLSTGQFYVMMTPPDVIQSGTPRTIAPRTQAYPAWVSQTCFGSIFSQLVPSTDSGTISLIV